MLNDIVLITIDCWRYDAVDRMKNLLYLTKGFIRTEALCQAAATNGVFPSIIAGIHYPYAYERCYYPNLGYGKLRQGVVSLPRVLSQNGYATGAFVASNPLLSKWAGHFDHFWNEGLSNATSDVIRFSSPSLRKIERIYERVLLRDNVTAAELGKRAKKWYRGTKRPRFLWMHVMEPHEGYLPGFRKGLKIGLLSSYRSINYHRKHREDISEKILNTLYQLYWQTIDYLDEQIYEVLGFIDEDATVIIMADHGHEFHHGMYRHVRLYDECVRVPLLIKWTLPNSLEIPEEPVRQIDLSPTILQGLGINVPDNWQGHAFRRDFPPVSPMAQYAPEVNRTYIGNRSPQYKLILTLDPQTGTELAAELYDLEKDGEESNNIYNNVKARELDKDLDLFRMLKPDMFEKERLKIRKIRDNLDR